MPVLPGQEKLRLFVLKTSKNENKNNIQNFPSVPDIRLIKNAKLKVERQKKT